MTVRDPALGAGGASPPRNAPPARSAGVHPALLALLFFMAVAVAFAPDAATGTGVFWHHDLRHHHFAWRAWGAQTWLSGEVPWWAPGAGNGFPLLAEGEGGLLYLPTMLLFVLLPDGLALDWSVLGHQVLAAMGVWAFLRAPSARGPGLRGVAPLLGGLAYAWSGFLISHTLYLGMQNAAAWLGWALLGATPGPDGRARPWLVALSVGMMGLAGHPQIAAFMGLGLGVHALVTLRGGALLRWVGAVALGGLIASPQLLATLELVQFSGRDGGVLPSFAQIGKLPLQELVGAVLPEAFGFDRPADIDQTYYHRGTGYWGAGVNHWEMCFYLGLPVVVLALVGARGRPGRGWAIGAAVATFLMLGGPAWELVRHLPGFDGFRFPARFALLTTLAVAVLAAHGVDHLRRARRPAVLAYRLRVVAAAFSLCTGVAYAGLHAFEAQILDVGEAYFLRQTTLPPPPLFDPGPLAKAALPAPELEDPAAIPAKVRRILADLRASTSPASPRVLVPLALLLIASFAVRRPTWWLALAALELWRFGHDYHPRVPADLVDARPPWLGSGMTEPGGPRLTVLDRRVSPTLDTSIGTASLGLVWGTSDVILPSPLLLVRNEAMLAFAGLDVGDTGKAKVGRYLANIALARRMGVRWIATTHRVPGLQQLVRGAVNVYVDPLAQPRVRVVPCARAVPTVDDAFTRVLAADPREEVVVEGVAEDEGCAGLPIAGAPEADETQGAGQEAGREAGRGPLGGERTVGEPGRAVAPTGAGTPSSRLAVAPAATGRGNPGLSASASGAADPADTRGAAAELATAGDAPLAADFVTYTNQAVTVRAEGPGTLVLADTWYPRWTARVDGIPTDILRADVNFRAVPLGAGEHEVTFRFDPGTPGKALWVAVFALIGVIGWGVRREAASPRQGETT